MAPERRASDHSSAPRCQSMNARDRATTSAAASPPGSWAQSSASPCSISSQNLRLPAFSSGKTTGSNAEANATGASLSPGMLSRRSFEVLGGIGNLFHRLQAPPTPSTSIRSPQAQAEPDAARSRVAMP